MKAVYKKIREMMIYKGVRGRAAHIFGVIMLVFLGLVFAMPLYWMISTALKYETYCFTTPPQWFPNPIKWSNFTEIFGRMDMRARLRDGPAVEQEFFRQRGFAGVRVRNDRKRPAAADLFL